MTQSSDKPWSHQMRSKEHDLDVRAEAKRADRPSRTRRDDQPNFTETSAAADGQGILGKDRARPADDAAALDPGPAVDTGASSRPQGPVLRGDPPFNTAGRSGADTSAGSHDKSGRAEADRDPASGGL